MAKDKTQGMQRIDLRIPDHIYSEIEQIAIANNLPFSPTTKPNTDGSLKVDKKGNTIQPKVSVSPIILDLISLGLKAIANGENSDKLGDKTRNIEYQVNSQIDVSDIEKKIINTLTQKIEGIVSDKIVSSLKTSTEIKDTLETMVEAKVKEVFEVFSLKELGQITDIESDLIPDSSDNFTTEIKEIFTIEDFEPIDTDNQESINEVEISEINHNEDNAQIEINLVDNTENNTLLESPIVPLNEDLGVIITNEDSPINKGLKSYEEAVIEIKRLKKEDLGNTAIAKKLTGKYYTAKGLINWSDTQVRRILKSAV